MHAAWTVELRGARATQMQRLDAEFLLPLLDKYPLVRWEITGIAEKRLRESTLLQVVPKEALVPEGTLSDAGMPAT